MKLFKVLATAFCLFVLCVLVVPTVTADDWNRETVITFSGPVEVPGVGLKLAGGYLCLQDCGFTIRPSHRSDLQPGQKQGASPPSWQSRITVCMPLTKP